MATRLRDSEKAGRLPAGLFDAGLSGFKSAPALWGSLSTRDRLFCEYARSMGLTGRGGWGGTVCAEASLGAGVWSKSLGGSSPLAWGEPDGLRVRQAGVGAILARTGTTTPSTTPRPGLRDHPRSCGDHPTIMPKKKRSTGSSPLVRGPRSYCAGRGFSRGIIPARAGTTRRCRICRARAWDHPRSCGDHLGVRLDGLRLEGSSPLVRGPHLTTSAFLGHFRPTHSLFATHDHPTDQIYRPNFLLA